MNMRSSLSFVLLATLVAAGACASDSRTLPPQSLSDAASGGGDAAAIGGAGGSTAADTGPGADGSLVPDGAGTTGPDLSGGDRWSEVDELIAKAVAESRVPGLGFVVYDSMNRKLFQRMYGDFAPSKRVAVASASKLVAGLVLLDLVGKGQLSLDSTTGQVLGWKPPLAGITLRHLLSFTSGLPRENLCTARPLITLAACVDMIGTSQPTAAPGERYDYGSTHLHVAARMAEVVTGKSWNQIFADTLAKPLGLPTEVQFYTAPKQAIGTTNPLVAGGMRASMDDYAKLLGLAFHKGRSATLNIGTPALFEEQAREPYPNVTVGVSPIRNVGLPYRYGLAAWLECDTPATGCAVVSSPGAFGWTPWFDRDVGYYAIIGTELERTDNDVVQFSVGLARDLKPLIAKALRGSR